MEDGGRFLKNILLDDPGGVSLEADPVVGVADGLGVDEEGAGPSPIEEEGTPPSPVDTGVDEIPVDEPTGVLLDGGGGGVDEDSDDDDGVGDGVGDGVELSVSDEVLDPSVTDVERVDDGVT